MKTPDEIKKGLEHCINGTNCRGCEYCEQCAIASDCNPMHKDLQEYIQQLEAERDAAVETIYKMAECITEDVCTWCDGVECERLCMPHAILRPGFKWRGVQKEE